MKLVLQRVKKGSVAIDGKIKGSIGCGFVALVGFGPNDDSSVLAPMADKMLHLRVFEDDAGKMIGYVLRGRSFVGVTKWSIQITVCVLLFVFGVSIGSDRNLVDNFYNFGWQAAVIACLGVLGSIVAARVAQRLFFKKGGES